MIPPDRYREGIIEALWGLASKEIQDEFQKNVRFVPVQVEIFCQWEDIYFPSVETFEIAFSKEERIGLAAFESLIDGLHPRGGDYRSLVDYQSSPTWEKVSAAALDTLALLGESVDDAA